MGMRAVLFAPLSLTPRFGSDLLADVVSVVMRLSFFFKLTI